MVASRRCCAKNRDSRSSYCLSNCCCWILRASSIHCRMSVGTEGDVDVEAIVDEGRDPEIELEEEVDA